MNQYVTDNASQAVCQTSLQFPSVCHPRSVEGALAVEVLSVVEDSDRDEGERLLADSDAYSDRKLKVSC